MIKNIVFSKCKSVRTEEAVADFVYQIIETVTRIVLLKPLAIPLQTMAFENSNTGTALPLIEMMVNIFETGSLNACYRNRIKHVRTSGIRKRRRADYAQTVGT